MVIDRAYNTDNGVYALLQGLPACAVRGEKIIETDSRWGAVHNGALVEKTLQQHTLEFAGGGTAFLDFNGVQYHSYLRSTHTSVQGERGEVFDDTLRCLDAAGEPSTDPAARPAGSCRRAGRA